jgi:cytochrome c-type biogenesis protein CcmH/NrfG
MKLESVIFGIAGVAFGLIVGWIAGSQQATNARAVSAPAPLTQPAAGAAEPAGQPDTPGRATVLDEGRAQALRKVAEGDPGNPGARAELGNMYFDAERYGEAIPWYTEALKLDPRNVNISTDLGVSYYYAGQTDRAIKQFEHSLSVDPKHLKTLLNLGVVRAFGQRDLQGATDAWKQVVALAPDSPEGQTARRSLDAIQSAHGETKGDTQGQTPSR